MNCKQEPDMDRDVAPGFSKQYEATIPNTGRQYHEPPQHDQDISEWKFTTRKSDPTPPGMYELEYAWAVAQPVVCQDLSACPSLTDGYPICNFVHDHQEAWQATEHIDNHFNRTNTLIAYRQEGQILYDDIFRIHHPFAKQLRFPYATIELWIHTNATFQEIIRRLPEDRKLIQQIMPFTQRRIIKSIPRDAWLTLQILNIQYLPNEYNYMLTKNLRVLIYDHNHMVDYEFQRCLNNENDDPQEDQLSEVLDEEINLPPDENMEVTMETKNGSQRSHNWHIGNSEPIDNMRPNNHNPLESKITMDDPALNDLMRYARQVESSKPKINMMGATTKDRRTSPRSNNTDGSASSSGIGFAEAYTNRTAATSTTATTVTLDTSPSRARTDTTPTTPHSMSSPTTMGSLETPQEMIDRRDQEIRDSLLNMSLNQDSTALDTEATGTSTNGDRNPYDTRSQQLSITPILTNSGNQQNQSNNPNFSNHQSQNNNPNSGNHQNQNNNPNFDHQQTAEDTTRNNTNPGSISASGQDPNQRDNPDSGGNPTHGANLDQTGNTSSHGQHASFGPLRFQLPHLIDMPKPKELEKYCKGDPTNLGRMDNLREKYTYMYESRQIQYQQVTTMACLQGIPEGLYQTAVHSFKSCQRQLRHIFDALCDLYNKSNTDENEDYLEMPIFGDESSAAVRDIQALPSFNSEDQKISLYHFWHKVTTFITTGKLSEEAAKHILAHRLFGQAYSVYMINKDQPLISIIKRLRDRWGSFPTKQQFEEDMASFQRPTKETIKSAMNRYEYITRSLYKNEQDVNAIVERECRRMVRQIAYPEAREALERQEKIARAQGVEFTYEDRLRLLHREEEILRKRGDQYQGRINTMQAQSPALQQPDNEIDLMENDDNAKIYSAVKTMLDPHKRRSQHSSSRSEKTSRSSSPAPRPQPMDTSENGNIQMQSGLDSSKSQPGKEEHIFKQQSREHRRASPYDRNRSYTPDRNPFTRDWGRQSNRQSDRQDSRYSSRNQSPASRRSMSNDGYRDRARSMSPFRRNERSQSQDRRTRSFSNRMDRGARPPFMESFNRDNYKNRDQSQAPRSSTQYNRDVGQHEERSPQYRRSPYDRPQGDGLAQRPNGRPRNDRPLRPPPVQRMTDSSFQRSSNPFQRNFDKRDTRSEPGRMPYRSQTSNRYPRPMIETNSITPNPKFDNKYYQYPFYRGNDVAQYQDPSFGEIKWANSPNARYQRGQGIRQNFRTGQYNNSLKLPKLMRQFIQLRPEYAGVTQYYDTDALCENCGTGEIHTIAECPKRRSPRSNYSVNTSPGNSPYRRRQ